MHAYRFTGDLERVFGHLHFDTSRVIRGGQPVDGHGAIVLQPGDELHTPEPEVHAELVEITRKPKPATEPQE